MNKIKYIFSIFVLLSNIAYAQKTEVGMYIDSTKFIIGDQINAILKVKTENKELVKWPELKDSLGSLEIVSKTKIDTLVENNYKTLSQSYKLTQFDSGTYILKPIAIKIGDSTFYTKQKTLQVSSVEVDTTKQKMYDIKQNIYVGYSFWEILPYVLILFVLGVMLYMFYFYWKKQKNKEKPVSVPKISPFDFAILSLKKLDEGNYLKDGNIKEFYVKLTDILRRYIEDEHDIPTMESTTDEIMVSVQRIDFSKEIKDKIRELLKESDFVKFAKYKPEERKHAYYRNTAEQIILAGHKIVEDNKNNDDNE